MIKKFLKWDIDTRMRLYNWGYPYTAVVRWDINSRIRFYNWLYPKDPIPLKNGATFANGVIYR